MIHPYEVGYYKNSNDYMQFFIDKYNKIYLMNDEDEDFIYIFENNDFLKINDDIAFEIKYFYSESKFGLRPATRNELKAAGLWDMVINKDDYSCLEDELESYLDLADEDKSNGLKG